jgi:hypothetical protein
MEKSTVTATPKKNYWAVSKGKKILHEGTFNTCWKYLTEKHTKKTIRELVEQDIRIGRIG